MKVKNIDTYSMRNDEHFQFGTEFRDTIRQCNPDELKIKPQFESWELLFGQEDEVLKKIFKSALTEDIRAADQKRDETFRGMVDTNKAALKHFREDVKVAAKRLQIVFDTYGNLAVKPQNEETSAVYNLLQELGNYTRDVEMVGIIEWVQELEDNNAEFDRLTKERYDESAQKTDLVLKQVRIQVDEAYRTIVERLNALMLLEGGEIYDSLIRRLNVVIEKYNNIIAQRQGRNAAKKDDDENNEPISQ